jgi:hypothetical protein
MEGSLVPGWHENYQQCKITSGGSMITPGTVVLLPRAEEGSLNNEKRVCARIQKVALGGILLHTIGVSA